MAPATESTLVNMATTYRIGWCPLCHGLIHPVITSHKARIHWRCVACHTTHWDEDRLITDLVDLETWNRYLRAQCEAPTATRTEFYQWQIQLAL